MLTAKDIATILQISQTVAYEIIREYKHRKRLTHRLARYPRSDFKKDFGVSDKDIDSALTAKYF